MNIHDFDECVLLDNIGKNTVKIQPTEIAIGTKEDPTIAVTIEPFNVDEMFASIKWAIKNIENACKQEKEK